MCELDVAPPSAEEVERARRGYYACVSYLDDQVGAILRRLEELGLRESTVVVFTSDHGDMLGERGLWYKMAPFEDSARVPLIVCAPGRYAGGRRIGRTVSLVDLLPTFAELAARRRRPADRRPQSFAGLLADDPAADAAWPDSAVIEYLAEGVRAPQLTLVSGQPQADRLPRRRRPALRPRRRPARAARPRRRPGVTRRCWRGCARSCWPATTSTR